MTSLWEIVSFGSLSRIEEGLSLVKSAGLSSRHRIRACTTLCMCDDLMPGQLGNVINLFAIEDALEYFPLCFSYPLSSEQAFLKGKPAMTPCLRNALSVWSLSFVSTGK